MEKIHFIMTGGTIDSYYDPSKDTAVPNEHSIIPQFVNSLKLHADAEYSEVCMKDSRNLDMNDLKKVLETVENSDFTKIIITHGTYTMPDTARYLKANLKRRDQVIIVTGSAIPIVGFSPSDGPFSLGYAFAKLEHLGNGIYVCMNGKVFSPDEVIKVINDCKFSSIFQK